MGIIPEQAFDFVPQRPPPIGCNRLLCRQCKQAVRDIPGVLTSATRAELAHAYLAGADALVLTPDALHRLYFCACGASASVGRDRLVDDPAADDYRGTLPGEWACAGHPTLVVPGVLDGEALPPADGWLALARGALDGTRAVARPEFVATPTSAWSQRVEWLLEATDEATGGRLAVDFGQAHAQLLRGELAHAALAFFEAQPLAAGAAAVESLACSLTAAPTEKSAASRESAGELIQLILVARLRSGAATSETVAAVQHAVGWSSKRQVLLLEALVAHDFAAALEQIDALVDAASPRPGLRAYALGAFAVDDVAGVVRVRDRLREIGRVADADALAKVVHGTLPPRVGAALKG